MHRLAEHFSGRTHIIWDWNGTLLDDIELCAGIVAELMTEHGMTPVSLEEYRRVFRFPVRDYYADLGFDFSRVSFEELSHQFMARYAPGLSQSRLFAGTVELLESLAAHGYTNAVLSAANESYLKEQLATYGVDRFFTHVYGLDNHHAASKIERGRQLMAALAVDPAKVLLVGDTDHDLEVARAMGIDALLLADGHQHHERLKPLTERLTFRSSGG